MRSGDWAYLWTARLMLRSRARCCRPSLLKRLNTPMFRSARSLYATADPLHVKTHYKKTGSQPAPRKPATGSPATLKLDRQGGLEAVHELFELEGLAQTLEV